MPAVCLYFQVHQPFRLHPYSVFQVGKNQKYWDKRLNKSILNRVADNCYLPANQALLEEIDRHEGKVKASFSLSGVLIEQLEMWRPDVLESFQKLAKTGCVDFLSETYYHSLAFLYSREEFFRQIIKHREKIWHYFQQDSRVFRHTELIYNDHLAYFLSQMGYKMTLVEGVDQALRDRSPNEIYAPPHIPEFCLLPRNYHLSDDIAFRFSDPNWSHYPLEAGNFANWLNHQPGTSINLFMDYETIGEHQNVKTGILEFFRQLPGEIAKFPNLEMKTPDELIQEERSKEPFYASEYVSWADAERDISAWQGNEMQKEALQKVFELESTILATQEEELIREWSLLQTSDHFYYMSTKSRTDGGVHNYFNPFSSPFAAYRHFMNVIADFQLKLR